MPPGMAARGIKVNVMKGGVAEREGLPPLDQKSPELLAFCAANNRACVPLRCSWRNQNDKLRELQGRLEPLMNPNARPCR